MRHDIRDALRMLLRSPGYSAITVAVLALGIGATSAIFSFVEGVLLRPLPYDEPNRIVWVWEKPPKGLRNTISTENFLDWQRSSGNVFEEIAAITGSGVTMAGGGNRCRFPVSAFRQAISTCSVRAPRSGERSAQKRGKRARTRLRSLLTSYDSGNLPAIEASSVKS
jgi:hypothetical protein